MGIKIVNSSDDRPLVSDFDPATGRPITNVSAVSVDEEAVEGSEKAKGGRKAKEATTVAEQPAEAAGEAPSEPAA